MEQKNRKKNFNIVSEWGVFSSRTDARTGVEIEIRLTKCSWFGKIPKWDLRSWTPTIAGQGIVIGDDTDLFRLRDMLVDVCKQIEGHPGEY